MQAECTKTVRLMIAHGVIRHGDHSLKARAVSTVHGGASTVRASSAKVPD